MELVGVWDSHRNKNAHTDVVSLVDIGSVFNQQLRNLLAAVLVASRTGDVQSGATVLHKRKRRPV